jgi:hypothetical protein
MICPYCLGHFAIERDIESDPTRIHWGLVMCRCFTFPIVDGVLLLSLAKQYGGSEEALQPYTAMQVAAIEFLSSGDLPGFRRWVARHVPLLNRLMAPHQVTYLGFMRDLNARLHRQVERDLHNWGRWEVLGRRGAYRRNPGPISALATTRIGQWLLRLRHRVTPGLFQSFYVSRFVSTQLADLRARLRPFPLDGPLLSLCCGHGPFEMLARARKPEAELISLDGQVLNLFVTRRFVNPGGDYICHDVQFPLPFATGAFRGVFSSSCLVEIPAQASFIRESIRVTAQDGWALFDAVTPEPSTRISPTRFYRVCQNPLTSPDDYFQLFSECAQGRPVQFTPTMGNVRWTCDPAQLATIPSVTFAIATGPIRSHDEYNEFEPGERARLSVNPRYAVREEHGQLVGRIRASERFEALQHGDLAAMLARHVTIERSRLSDSHYLADLYHAGTLVFLPHDFAHDTVAVFPH